VVESGQHGTELAEKGKWAAGQAVRQVRIDKSKPVRDKHTAV
jgi:hypothetical protein